MAGSSVRLNFGFCDADIKANHSLDFHQHRWSWPASQQTETVISRRAYFWIIKNSTNKRERWYVTICKTSRMMAEQTSVSNRANPESESIFCQLLIVDETCVRIIVLCIDTRRDWLFLNYPCVLMGGNCRHTRRATGRDPDEQFAFRWKTFFEHWWSCDI